MNGIIELKCPFSKHVPVEVACEDSLLFDVLTLCTRKPKIRLLRDASAARKPKIRLRGLPIINNY